MPVNHVNKCGFDIRSYGVRRKIDPYRGGNTYGKKTLIKNNEAES
ncbi:hypothetical protein SAMN04488057_11410 [Cyclobacterium lianum]|uniref:Uncharacterized protein n=1 Tax=Cyclobacterium lianum TaxID=388280 RepID=A0A1M7Q4Q6_9BACT|nr:hypothetical protein SAMN04488057_11410 [Cyclobacterium lianum]